MCTPLLKWGQIQFQPQMDRQMYSMIVSNTRKPSLYDAVIEYQMLYLQKSILVLPAWDT